MRRILLTGFMPFDGREHNASWIAARAVAAETHAGLALRAELIPVCWGAPRAVLEPVVRKWRPHCVIGMGEGEQGVFRLETLARNARRERPDNEGRVPGGEAIRSDGPDCRQGSADFPRLCNALGARKVPVKLSVDAGAFLCEELLYTLEEMRLEHDFIESVLFVHLPPYGTELVYKGTPHCCDEELLLDFSRTLLEAVLESDDSTHGR